MALYAEVKYGTLYRMSSSKLYPSLSTCFHQLDHLEFLFAGSLTVLTGQKTGGKTTLSMNLAEHVLVNEGREVLFITQGVSQKTLLGQMACCLMGLDWLDCAEGRLSEAERVAVDHAEQDLLKAGLSIETEPHLSDEELAKHIDGWASEHPRGFVLLDHIRRRGSIESDKCSWMLKSVAQKNDVAIFATAELSELLEPEEFEFWGPSPEYADHEWLLLRPWCSASELFERYEASLFVSDRRTGESLIGVSLALDEALRRFRVTGQIPPSGRSLREIRREKPSGTVFHKVLGAGENPPPGARVVYHHSANTLTDGLLWVETLTDEDIALIRRGF